MTQLCSVLGVNPDDVSWDAATEELEGDVRSVLWNILEACFGEDWWESDEYAAMRSKASRGNNPNAK